MPGVKGRSGGSKGRVKKDLTIGKGAFEAKLPDPSTAPELGDTVGSIEAHARWAAAELLAGRMDRGVAESLTKIHRSLLAGARQRHAEQEMIELRDMVRQADEASRRALGNQVRDRGHTAAHTPAEWPAEDVPADQTSNPAQ
jgi:hypothetical protein